MTAKLLIIQKDARRQQRSRDALRRRSGEAFITPIRRSSAVTSRSTAKACWSSASCRRTSAFLSGTPLSGERPTSQRCRRGKSVNFRWSMSASPQTCRGSTPFGWRRTPRAPPTSAMPDLSLWCDPSQLRCSIRLSTRSATACRRGHLRVSGALRKRQRLAAGAAHRATSRILHAIGARCLARTGDSPGVPREWCHGRPRCDVRNWPGLCPRVCRKGISARSTSPANAQSVESTFARSASRRPPVSLPHLQRGCCPHGSARVSIPFNPCVSPSAEEPKHVARKRSVVHCSSLRLRSLACSL